MIAKRRLVCCTLMVMICGISDAQEYVSRKVNYSPEVQRQDLLVGVGNEDQWSLVSRLTSTVGQTLSLESVNDGVYFDDPSDEAYHRLNERALQLRSAKVIFVAPHAACGTAKLWYERLANHGVRVIELRPVSARHQRRASDSLARQIYLGLFFVATDRQTIDENFCKVVNDIESNRFDQR